MSFIEDIAKEGLGSLASELLSVSVKFGAEKAASVVKDATGLDIKVDNDNLVYNGKIDNEVKDKLKELDKQIEIDAELNRLSKEMGQIELEDVAIVNDDLHSAREMENATGESDKYLVKYIVPILAVITLTYTFIVLMLPIIKPDYIIDNSRYLELVGLSKAMAVAVLVYLFGGSLGSYLKARAIKRKAVLEDDENKGMF